MPKTGWQHLPVKRSILREIVDWNDLASGAVTWWTGNGWSIHVEDAVDVGESGDAILHAEEGARA